MKNRYLPIITATLAILLVGSIVYASDRKKKVRLPVHEPSEMSEEALKAELLADSGDHHEKTAVNKSAGSSKRAAVAAKEKVK